MDGRMVNKWMSQWMDGWIDSMDGWILITMRLDNYDHNSDNDGYDDEDDDDNSDNDGYDDEDDDVSTRSAGQHVHSSDTVLYRRVSGISDRVVLGAKRYCESKVTETKGAIEQLSREYPSQEDLAVAHKVRVLELREEERRWIQASC